MNRGDVGLVLGLAGFLLGGWAVYVATATRKDFVETKADVDRLAKSDDESLGGMAEKLTDLGESNKELSKRLDRMSTDPKALWDAVNALQSRVQKLEAGGGVVRPFDASKDGSEDGGLKDGPPKDGEKK